MQPFEPDFEIIKMDAEIGSCQEDFEPEPNAPEVTPVESDDTKPAPWDA